MAGIKGLQYVNVDFNCCFVIYQQRGDSLDSIDESRMSKNILSPRVSAPVDQSNYIHVDISLESSYLTCEISAVTK